MRPAAIAVIVATLALGSVEGYSHQLQHRDPDDVSGHLDVRLVDVNFYSSGGRGTMILQVFTYDRFRNSDLEGFGGSVTADFDGSGGGRADYFVRFKHSPISGLYCEVLAVRGSFQREGIATRDRRELVCVFPRRWLNVERHLRWRVLSCCPIDEAPEDSRWFRH
jgi:hypothetical protein